MNKTLVYFQDIYPKVKEEIYIGLDELSTHSSILYKTIMLMNQFYHHYLLDDKFVTSYEEECGIFGEQELREFEDLYEFMKGQQAYIETFTSKFILTQSSVDNLNLIPKPYLFLAESLCYPMKKWITSLIRIIELYTYFELLSSSPDTFSEEILHNVFFIWNIDSKIDRIENLLRPFMKSYVYI